MLESYFAFQAAERIYMPIFDNLVRDIFRGPKTFRGARLGIPLFLMVR